MSDDRMRRIAKAILPDAEPDEIESMLALPLGVMHWTAGLPAVLLAHAPTRDGGCRCGHIGDDAAHMGEVLSPFIRKAQSTEDGE